jgi:asparagine synthase (glutamine-hydrolysing)
VGGELAVGYWYPAHADGDGSRERAFEAALRHLMSASPAWARSDDVTTAERLKIVAILDHAVELGLSDLEAIDYAYLVERVRRWYSSAYFVGMVTPFLSPHFVRASFAISPAQKRARVLHQEILERLVPEWADVPYVTASSGRSTGTRISEGDGLTAIGDLLGTVDGLLTRLMRQDSIETALARFANGRGGGPEERVLQHFVCIAMANQTLEPAAIRTRPSSGWVSQGIARAAAPPVAVSAGTSGRIFSRFARRLAFVKRYPGGRVSWNAARAVLIRLNQLHSRV